MKYICPGKCYFFSYSFISIHRGLCIVHQLLSLLLRTLSEARAYAMDVRLDHLEAPFWFRRCFPELDVQSADMVPIVGFSIIQSLFQVSISLLLYVKLICHKAAYSGIWRKLILLFAWSWRGN